MQFKWIFLLIGLNFFCLFAQAAPDSNLYDLPEVVAVQNRNYFLDDDLTFQAGALPGSAFYNNAFVGLTYTYYFKDYLAWEVVNANYNLKSDKKIKEAIENNFDLIGDGQDVVESALDPIVYFVSTNLVYTPMYIKSLLFNETVIRGEISFTGGGGIVNFKNQGVGPMVNIGMYFRFISGPTSSWKFDFRNNLTFPEAQGLVNEWSIGVGYSMQLGSAPEELQLSE